MNFPPSKCIASIKFLRSIFIFFKVVNADISWNRFKFIEKYFMKEFGKFQYFSVLLTSRKIYWKSYKEIYLQQGCCSIELTQIPPCKNCQYCTIFCQFSQTSSEFIEFYEWMSDYMDEWVVIWTNELKYEWIRGHWMNEWSCLVSEGLNE